MPAAFCGGSFPGRPPAPGLHRPLPLT
ncbi:hypothetical protein CO2235_30151 [Cupriavidus oxalaticus]|uniref:Uncharacterized protein n=1 Tax=Cupriavidus oxalaticus TaxID=96344 RepID=A0A375GA53_9BURK|nr:hypothetical protein CO2235_30151 [Cupriavidus oxalaticus]